MDHPSKIPPSHGPSGSECIRAEVALALAMGEATDAERGAALDHLDSCEDCRIAIADAARTGHLGDSSEKEAFKRFSKLGSQETQAAEDLASADTEFGLAPSPASEMGRPEPGTVIGRYVIESFLGSGGMGLVMLASDPELARKVTIKLLRPGLANAKSSREQTKDAEARLLREAQAMAQVSHPNVVPIYDIGTWNEQVFIAMEYLDGGSLAQWLEGADRPVPDVIEKFAKAGRGLAAAHRAGLVHRDFKPANVMLSAVGEVKVTDFGLARSQTAAPSPERESKQRQAIQLNPRSGGIGLDSPLTAAGVMVGTPAYMAPEQIYGEPTDSRTDVFSFCVALHEGVFGHRPFAGGSTTELLDAIERGERRSRSAKRGGGLQRLDPIFARGLAAEPDRRYQSIDDVLRELVPRKKRWLAISAIAATLALAASLAWWGTQRGREVDLVAASTMCGGGNEAIAAVWNSELAAKAEAAIAATSAIDGAKAGREFVERMNKKTTAWTAMHFDACAATRIEGSQTEDLLGKRMACLERHRVDIDDIVGRATLVTSSNVSRLLLAAESLPSTDSCANESSMASEVRRPPANVRDVVLRSEELTARALQSSYGGSDEEALEIAKQAVALARKTEYAPAEASALFTLAKIEEVAGDLEGAVETLGEVIEIAKFASEKKILADAYTNKVVLLSRLSRYDEAARWSRFARKALDELGGDLEAEAVLAMKNAHLLGNSGDIRGALASAERAIALRKQDTPVDQFKVAEALWTLSRVHLDFTGNPKEALRNAQLADKIGTEVNGLDAAENGFLIHHLALAQAAVGQTDRALKTLDRMATALRKMAGMGEGRIELVDATRRNILSNAGRYDEAIVIAQELVKFTASRYGLQSYNHGDALLMLSLAETKDKRIGAALKSATKARAIAIENLGETGEMTLLYKGHHGTLLLRSGKKSEASIALKAALAGAVLVLPANSPTVEGLRSRYGEALVATGDHGEAIELLRSALKSSRDRNNKRLIAASAWPLAQALIATGEPASEAKSLAIEARDYYAGDGNDAKLASKIQRWLRQI